MDCKECNNNYSCQIMQHRFKVKECEIGKEMIVNKGHLKELQDREVLLKGLSE
jgi:hypothetical protein